jgi:hypothetical protein
MVEVFLFGRRRSRLTMPSAPAIWLEPGWILFSIVFASRRPGELRGDPGP